MKKIILIGIAAIVALYSVASCAKFEQPNAPVDAETEIENPADGDFTVTFECILDNQEESGEGGTKTVFHENTIWWAKGDIISFIQYAKSGGKNEYIRKSLSARTEDKATIGNVAISDFNKPDEDTKAHYLSWCPEKSFNCYKSPEKGYLIHLTLPSEQIPTASSYDKEADIVISEYYEAESNETTIRLRYTHPNSFGRMTIINLPSSSNIKTVEFSAIKDGQAVLLAGARYYDFQTGCHSEETAEKYDEEKNSISLDYSKIALGNNPTAYFCCYPFELGAEDSFKVTVTTTAGEVFEKEITLLEETINKLPGKKFVFAQNKATKFTVDMSTATKTCEWLSLSPYSSGSYVSTIEKTYAGLTGSDIASAKWCTADMATFSGITDFDTYIENNGNNLSDAGIINLNSDKIQILPKTGTIDTKYAFIVKAINNSGQSVILTTTARTDWLKLDLVKRSGTTAGVQIQISAVNVSTKSRAWRIVPTSTIEKISDIESYFTNTLKPGIMNETYVEGINSKNGEIYQVNINKYHTGDGTTTNNMVTGTSYTILAKFQNSRGETTFRTASAIAN